MSLHQEIFPGKRARSRDVDRSHVDVLLEDAKKSLAVVSLLVSPIDTTESKRARINEDIYARHASTLTLTRKRRVAQDLRFNLFRNSAMGNFFRFAYITHSIKRLPALIDSRNSIPLILGIINLSSKCIRDERGYLVFSVAYLVAATYRLIKIRTGVNYASTVINYNYGQVRNRRRKSIPAKQ